MTMKSEKKTNYNKTIEELLVPSSEKERLLLQAQMIQLDFISRLEELMKLKGIKSKKELAGLMGITPSFISQLFSAEKLINLKHLARLQDILEVKYNIISDQYLRFRSTFREKLASMGYRETRIIPNKLSDNTKLSA